MVPDENSVEISTFSIACFSLISGRKKKIPTETIYQASKHLLVQSQQ